MKFISLCSLTAIATMAAPTAAQGILPYLPKDTVMAMAAPDIAMSMAEFKQMPLAKMWAEEEVQTFFADIMEMAEEQMGGGIDMAEAMHAQMELPPAINPEQLMQLRINGATLAVTSLGMEMSPFGPMPNIGLIAHLDFGASADTWNTLTQMGLGMMMAEAGDMAEMSETTVGDIKLMTMTPAEMADITDMSLNIAMVPGGILLGTKTAEIKAILENMASKTPDLGASAGYTAATKRMNTAGAEAHMFMAPNMAIDFAMNTLGMMAESEPEFGMIDIEGIDRAITAMGMKDIGTLALSSSYENGKCVTRSTHAKTQTGTAATKSIDKSFLKWVPKDAVAFSASTLDIASIYDTVVKGLQAYDPEMAEMALGQLAQMEQGLGFSIRNDLFGSLGDHFITWSMPMGTISSAPEMTLLMKVNNEEKLVAALKNMTSLTQGVVELEEGTKRGVKSYQLLINFDPSDGMMGMNPFDLVQPTFAFKDGYMVAGFSASDVKRVFRRMDREDNPKGDIRSNKEFAAIADTIPSNVTALSFTDWKADFESMYQLATGVLAFVPMPEEVPIDMSLLPDSETLTQHLFASVSYQTKDANGSETVNVSPFGPEMSAVGIAIIGAIAGFAAAQSESGF